MCRSAVLLAALVPLVCDAQVSGWIENQSYDTLCAEMDNINIPIFCSNATSYRIVASNPRYNPTSINEWGADFTDCTFGDDTTLWQLGGNDGSGAEFMASGFLLGDVYYAPDNPAEGLDEAVSNLPREINNDWMYDQYIQFSANEDNDANIEVQIGAVLTLDLAQISGTLEIKVLTQSTNGWMDHGSRVFNSSNLWRTWDLPDHVWMEGTDTNVIHLRVIRACDGGQTTTNAWAYYDQLSLVRRSGRGSNAGSPAVLYSGSNTIVEAVWIDFWWRNPREMKINVVGGATINTSQYLRIKRRMPDSSNWNEIFVLYEDGNARIIPFPPTNLGAIPYGASVILGPTTNCPRPAVGIDEVTVDPEDLSLDIKYQNGGTAHVELRAHRDGHIVDVSKITYDVMTHSVARFRSMWVRDGKSDIDRVESQDGVYPIMDNWTNLPGSWWQFFKEVPSYHNTYCPEFRVEIMGTNQGVFVREAESLDSGTHHTVTFGRTNAYGGQTLAFGTNGGEAVYNITLPSAASDVYMHVRYSDLDGGDAIDHLGNTIKVIVDGVQTVQTYSVNTGGWDEFEIAPSLYLGALAAGAHTLKLIVGAGTVGIELDWFDLMSESPAGAAHKTLLTRQGESYNSGTNAEFRIRGDAVGTQTVYLVSPATTWASVDYTNINLSATYSNTYLRVRYVDELAANQVRVYVDGQQRAMFPTEDAPDWNTFTNIQSIYLGVLTAGVHTIRFASSNETYGMEIDEFELFSRNHAPWLSLPAFHLLPVGSSTGFVVTATDGDGDVLILTHESAPAGSAFVTNWFTWTAAACDEATTCRVYFVANDQQGLSNSVVTNAAVIAVPYDSDADELGDGWEWNCFTTLRNTAADDFDADGLDNYSEYVADTSPTDAASSFVVSDLIDTGGQTNHMITVDTRPGRKYTIFFKDWILSNEVPWTAFASINRGVWIETGTVSGTHTFIDDEGADTSGSGPVGGSRFYRVKVKKP